MFNLSSEENSVLKEHRVSVLYIHFFDVAIDPVTGRVSPRAVIDFKEPPPSTLSIIPVVFITNEVLLSINAAGVDSLSKNITRLVTATARNHGIRFEEFQLDCDWTKSTKDKYFQLLRTIRTEAAFKEKRISVTVRLHQLKYRSESGIPPVDRGMLMCYNMGDLKNPSAGNSIIDPGIVRQYTRALDTYPLPLDLALPNFSWYVLFRKNRFSGIIYDERQRLPQGLPYLFHSDTSIANYEFKKGDGLRYEISDPQTVTQVAKEIGEKLPPGKMNLALYHLDAASLKKFSSYDLEVFYNSLR